MAEVEKRKLIDRLRNRYRLSVLNETTFEERTSLLLTPLNVIFMLCLVVVVIGSITYLLVAYTPLKEYIVPDFTDYEYREDAHYSRQMVDSLLDEIELKDRYLNDLKVVLSGGVVSETMMDTNATVGDEDLQFVLSEEDSSLRARISKEDQFAVNMDDDKPIDFRQVFPFKPIDGSVSSDFDPLIGHYGIDIVAPQNEVVKSIMDGTVIFASYSSDGGNVIQIQHDYNLVSMYKHNSTLFKKVGDQVKAGSSIAVIGESGDHAEGPHLHFELWLEGNPVNPRDYFIFED